MEIYENVYIAVDLHNKNCVIGYMNEDAKIHKERDANNSFQIYLCEPFVPWRLRGKKTFPAKKKPEKG